MHFGPPSHLFSQADLSMGLTCHNFAPLRDVLQDGLDWLTVLRWCSERCTPRRLSRRHVQSHLLKYGGCMWQMYIKMLNRPFYPSETSYLETVGWHFFPPSRHATSVFSIFFPLAVVWVWDCGDSVLSFEAGGKSYLKSLLNFSGLKNTVAGYKCVAKHSSKTRIIMGSNAGPQVGNFQIFQKEFRAPFSPLPYPGSTWVFWTSPTARTCPSFRNFSMN